MEGRTGDRRRVLTELPLPLGPDAGPLDALGLAVAIEDGCGVTLPDPVITVDHLGDLASIEVVLDGLSGST